MRKIILSATAAYLCTMVYSHSLIPTGNDWVAWHRAHVEGYAPAPLQYRWLSFMVAELISRIGIQVPDSYIFERFIFTTTALYFFGRAASVANRNNSYSLFGFYVVSLALYYSAATLSVMQPSEEINLAFFSIGFFMLVKNINQLWWPLFIALGALNKDTIGFFIPFILMYEVMSGRGTIKLYVSCALASIAFISVYLFLREIYGSERAYLGGLMQLSTNMDYFMRHPFDSIGFIIPSILPLILTFIFWRKTPIYMKAYIPTIALFTIGHLLISMIQEFRTYSALAVVTLPYMLSLIMEKQGTINTFEMTEK
jgi:hypothetical protein